MSKEVSVEEIMKVVDTSILNAIAGRTNMASFSFASVTNNPSLKGSLAAPKQYFGEASRYAVAPVHTRFDAIEWFVWDAEHPNSNLDHAEIIRQAETLEEAVSGLAQ